MLRWTNVLPYYLTNLRFYQEDPDFIADFLKSWLDMSADYERNKDTGKFENDMTECYVKHNHGLVPDEYGLIVIDYVNHVILTSQYYTRIGMMSSVGLMADLEGCVIYDKDDETEVHQFSQLWDDNRIQRVDSVSRDRKIRKRGWEKDVQTLAGKTADEVLEIIKKDEYDFNFYFDTNPFVIEDFREGEGFFYKETGEDWRRFHDRILELGFILTPEEEAIWQGRINETRDAPFTVFGARVSEGIHEEEDS